MLRPTMSHAINKDDLLDLMSKYASHLEDELAKANERVKELEKDAKNNELVHVGYTNGDQVKYAKLGEGAFYPDTSGDCYIPLYMLKSHEHRIETTSIQQLRKELEK